MKTINKQLFRMIKNTKGQFIAVTIILVIGLVFYASLRITSINIENSLNHYYNGFKFADLSISVNRVTNQQIKELENFKGIDLVEGRVTETVPFLTKDDEDNIKIKVISYNGNDTKINKLFLEDGNFLDKKSKDALLIKTFAETRGINLGDIITLQIDQRDINFKIVGLVSSPEFVYLVESGGNILPNNDKFGIVFISEAYAQQIFGYSGSYNDIQFIESDRNSLSDEDDLIEDIEKYLKKFGGTSVLKREKQLSNALVQSEIDELHAMTKAIPTIFLVIAGSILTMMIGRMVKKDRKSIGIMKTMGYSTFDISFYYIKYALLVGIAGGIFGNILGIILAGAFTDFYGTMFKIPTLYKSFNIIYVFTILIISILFCVVSGFWGIKDIVKIQPAESMRAEAPQVGKKIILERIRFLWKAFSFSEKMAMKNVFRNKKRTFFVLIGISFTFALTIFIYSLPKMIDEMYGTGLREFQPMDYSIDFKRPLSKEVLKDLKVVLDGEIDVEGRINSAFKLVNGTKETSLNIVGVPKDTIYYNFRDKKNNIVEVSNSGILISDYIAKDLGLKIGDSVKLVSYSTSKDDKWIEVKGIIYQALGTGAYVDADFLRKEYLEKDVVTGAYINSNDPEAEKKLQSLSNVSSISSIKTIEDTFTDFTKQITAMISIFIVLTGILGFSIIYNSTIISIGEREVELASLRILGFSKFEIFKLILRENIIITIGGIILGVPLSFLIGIYGSDLFSTDQYTMNPSADFKIWCLGISTIIAFLIIAHIATLRKINNLDFLSALKDRE